MNPVRPSHPFESSTCTLNEERRREYLALAAKLEVVHTIPRHFLQTPLTLQLFAVAKGETSFGMSQIRDKGTTLEIISFPFSAHELKVSRTWCKGHNDSCICPPHWLLASKPSNGLRGRTYKQPSALNESSATESLIRKFDL